MTQVGDRLDGRTVFGIRRCGAKLLALFSLDGEWVELADAPPPAADPAPEAAAPDPAANAPAA